MIDSSTYQKAYNSILSAQSNLAQFAFIQSMYKPINYGASLFDLVEQATRVNRPLDIATYAYGQALYDLGHRLGLNLEKYTTAEVPKANRSNPREFSILIAIASLLFLGGRR